MGDKSSISHLIEAGKDHDGQRPVAVIPTPFLSFLHWKHLFRLSRCPGFGILFEVCRRMLVYFKWTKDGELLSCFGLELVMVNGSIKFATWGTCASYMC